MPRWPARHESPAPNASLISLGVQWTGFATDTFDGLGAHTVDGGGPVDQPAALTCGGPLVAPAGTAASRTVTAVDPDDTVVDLAVTSVTQPSHGSVTLVAGVVSYTPNANYNGDDSFTYTVTDDGTTNGVLDAKSDTATVDVTVAGLFPTSSRLRAA